MQPLASAIIDTYNHERFIEQAILSVLEQGLSESELEILVVDDGSTDNTPDIVRRFEPRVRLIRKPNQGQASAFNVGIAAAQGQIIAFLDGDDWWGPAKLSVVAKAFTANASVGLVGHGITEVYLDGRRREEVPRELCHFRISSVDDAKRFTRLRAFLGTSRMSYRRDILRSIGTVPETLKFEADEYLFTLAGFQADVLILNESLTFYRQHENNLYQISAGGAQAMQRKQRIMATLAESLREKLKEDGIPPRITRPILDAVTVEADILRLIVESGFPWETVITELKVMRLFHADASFGQHLFTCARLLPALAVPARTYYRWRHKLSSSKFYRKMRQKFMPFPVPGHVRRTDRPGP